MAEIALVTSNFGEIDDLKALPSHDGVDAYYYTDSRSRALANPAVLASWTSVLVPDYPRHDFGPRLRSRYFKHQIHRLDEVSRHRWLVWADAAFELHETRFILDQVERLEGLSGRERFLLIPHPERQTIREEYEFIRTEIEAGNEYLRIRYGQEKMTEQMAYFAQRRWDLGARLWCGGFWIVENSDLMNRCWDAWWDQNLRFGMMDQHSLPVLLDEFGCEAQSFNVSVWRNSHFTHVGHQRVI